MIFKKRELKEKLGLNPEEVKLVLDYQEKLPILSEEAKGFCVDARKLHEQLCVGTEFAKWIKRRIEKFKFEENLDFEVIVKNDENLLGGRPSEEYHITMDMAKEISMVENNEQGFITRKYFILIEKILKHMVEWNRVRKPEKENYKLMCEELSKYLQRNKNRLAQNYDFMNEANALNLVCLGARAKDIKDYFDAQDKATREHLLKEYNIYLDKMQELNIMYLKMNLEKEVRYDLIKQGFKALYPFASFIIANKNETEKESLKNII